jgi:hypothetical protein
MKNKFLLEPLWITRGSSLDAEYFNYVLMAASLKYKEELNLDKIDRFGEVLFHILNLNNLAVSGTMFNQELKEVYDDSRIKQIRDELKKLYSLSEDTGEIFKNANFVFLNLLLEYMEIELDILGKLKIFYTNTKLHEEKEIFLVINKAGSKKYGIWKLCLKNIKRFGYRLTKLKSINIEEFEEGGLVAELKKLEDPRLSGISKRKNIAVAISLEREEERKIAQTLADSILLNRGITRGRDFHPTIIDELYNGIWFEKILPFTLDKWRE